MFYGLCVLSASSPKTLQAHKKGVLTLTFPQADVRAVLGRRPGKEGPGHENKPTVTAHVRLVPSEVPSRDCLISLSPRGEVGNNTLGVVVSIK